MTLFILAGIFLRGLSANAGSIGCETDPHDVQALLAWNADQVVLKVVSPMGYDHLPQLEAPISASSAPFLKMQTDDLKGLGDQFTVTWKRSQCVINEDDAWIINCGPGTLEGGGKEGNGVQNVGFAGAVETERRSDRTQERWKVRLVFSHGGTYFVTLPLAKEFCRKI